MTEPGSRLTEELRLLIDAVTERAGPWLDRVAASTHDDHVEPAAGSCAWCPLCAFVAAFRGEPSELAARGLDRLAELVALLRAVLADRWEPGVPHMPGFKPTPSASATDDSPPASRVQRIPVRRRAEPVGDG